MRINNVWLRCFQTSWRNIGTARNSQQSGCWQLNIGRQCSIEPPNHTK